MSQPCDSFSGMETRKLVKLLDGNLAGQPAFIALDVGNNARQVVYNVAENDVSRETFIALCKFASAMADQTLSAAMAAAR